MLAFLLPPKTVFIYVTSCVEWILARRTIDYVQFSVEVCLGDLGGRKAFLVFFCCSTFIQTSRQHLGNYFFLNFLCLASHHDRFLFTWHNYFGFKLSI